ncbi:hypothetical protein [Mycobacterium sp. ACS4054]|uniref:hypothetical protein n=1 Tax=Mycobacterium sp. ACS4054 TaxID=1834119 RepID=UPI0012EA2BCD|nr:hypothetical protein [Mycobacterium sp. ACS4054]
MKLSTFRDPIPKTVADVTRRADAYQQLFSPHLDVLRAAYGESIDEHLRQFCTNEPATMRRTTRTFSWISGVVCAIAIVCLYASSQMPFWWRMSAYPSGPLHMPDRQFWQAEWGIISSAILLFAIVYSTDWTIRLSRYELRKVFKLALHEPRSRLFAPYIYKPENAFRRPSAMFAVGIAAFSVELSTQSSNVYWSTLLNAFGIVSISMSAVVLVLFAGIGNSLFWQTAIPVDINAFYRVCTILWALPGLSKDIELRRYIIGQLSLLANAFESFIPKRLGLIGNNPSEVSAEQFYRIAASIRELRMWVAFPQPGTGQSLGERIAFTGGAIASHHYHYLIPPGETPVPLALLTWRQRLVKFLRHAAFGVIPLVGLLLAKLVIYICNESKEPGATPFQLSPQIVGVWTVVSVVWIVVSVAASDPDFKEKIAATKDTVNWFTGRKPA